MPTNSLTDKLKQLVDFAQGVTDTLTLEGGLESVGAVLDDPEVNAEFAYEPPLLRVVYTISEASLPQIRAELHQLLIALASDELGHPVAPITYTPLVSKAIRPGRKVVIVLNFRSVRDQFIHWVLELLRQAGVQRLLVCPACGRLFVKVTRKEYCSTRCQSRLYMRSYMKEKREQDRKAKQKGRRNGGKTARTR